ncbi:MAG: hypothetical protein RIT81_33040 [Deltaproteobacteria bacterium]
MLRRPAWTSRRFSVADLCSAWSPARELCGAELARKDRMWLASRCPSSVLWARFEAAAVRGNVDCLWLASRCPSSVLSVRLEAAAVR